jgi:cytochrome c peroxidase
VRIVALVLVLIGLGAAAAGAVDAVDAPAPSRNEIWRSIFARPSAPPGPGDLPERVALGHDLFRDTRLSSDSRGACVSCHDPDRSFTDGRRIGQGPRGEPLTRNVPALYNLAWARSFFWDGRAPTLEEQAKGPLLSPNELAGDFPGIVERLKSDPAMMLRFALAFPETPVVDEHVVDEHNVLAALAAYERSLVSGEARFDRWVAGDDAALSEHEMQGFAIFVGKGGCVACHGGWRFTDDDFHDVGVKSDDPGRGAVPGGTPGLPLFKTPSLREVDQTAPYMHDGSLATLADVVNHYAGDFVKRPSLAPTLVRDLQLTDDEKQSLIAFLRTLSSHSALDEISETTRPTPKK